MDQNKDDTGILFKLENHVAEITLNRPERLNSFNATMHIALRELLETLEKSADCRCILLTGAGRAFCTGQDLNDRDPRKNGGPPDLQKSLTTQFNPLVELIRRIPKPFVSAVNGVAAGAGANLALASDIVLASKQAKFIQSFARVGLIPDAGGTWMLPRLIGEARAKAVAMTGIPVSAEEARTWGMIWSTHESEELMTNARSLAMQLACGATLGIGQTKLCIQNAGETSFHEHLKQEAAAQGKLGRSADYAEGVVSFLDKREPVFTGS